MANDIDRANDCDGYPSSLELRLVLWLQWSGSDLIRWTPNRAAYAESWHSYLSSYGAPSFFQLETMATADPEFWLQDSALCLYLLCLYLPSGEPNKGFVRISSERLTTVFSQSEQTLESCAERFPLPDDESACLPADADTMQRPIANNMLYAPSATPTTANMILKTISRLNPTSLVWNRVDRNVLLG